VPLLEVKYRLPNQTVVTTPIFLLLTAPMLQRLPSGVAVSVKSWSINCPQATSMTVPACSWRPSSGWIVRDTTRARGNGSPEAATLDADILSANREDISLKTQIIINYINVLVEKKLFWGENGFPRVRQ